MLGLAAMHAGEKGLEALVEQYGPAPGGRAMMKAEAEAAAAAIASKRYAVYRSAGTDFCARVGPRSRCFCGHDHKAHGAQGCGTAGCRCRNFRWVPRRPEEVGEWWLPRRRGFQVQRWRAKCRCGHAHTEHHEGHASMLCAVPGCACMGFTAAFACLACDKRWEEHETTEESEAERRRQGRPVGPDFFPLAESPKLQRLVFGGEGGVGAHGRGLPSNRKRPSPCPPCAPQGRAVHPAAPPPPPPPPPPAPRRAGGPPGPPRPDGAGVPCKRNSDCRCPRCAAQGEAVHRDRVARLRRDAQALKGGGGDLERRMQKLALERPAPSTLRPANPTHRPERSVLLMDRGMLKERYPDQYPRTRRARPALPPRDLA